MTVLEVIQRSTDFLRRKGVESPRLQVEWLLAHLLKMPRLQLYLNFERPLAPAELETLREMVSRRGAREPLQHITGSTSFCGLEIEVNRNVLVPRPETETLAERGWNFLKSLATAEGRIFSSTASPRAEQLSQTSSLHHPEHLLSPPSEEKVRATGAQGRSVVDQNRTHGCSALDYGTGSGCIAIALAAHVPGARILAVDASEEALAVARRNADRNQAADRIEFRLAENLAGCTRSGGWDLIISNPPYIPSVEISGLDPEVKDFDPRLALDGGGDGLKFYRQLASEARPLLQPRGKLMIEFGDGQEKAVEGILREAGWSVEAVEADLSGRPRILVANPGGA